MKAIFSFLCLLMINTAFAQEYTDALLAAKMDLDSAWEHTVAPPADKICLPQEANIMRKKQLSDHQCIENAIQAARTQGLEPALNWLFASQCHNPAAQDRVRKAGNDAVRYVMNKWGGGQDGISGIAKPVDVTASSQPAVLNMRFTNHSGDWVYIYSLDTDMPEGSKECKEYKELDRLAPNRSYLRTVPKGRYVWIRFSNKRNGCTEFLKEYKVGLAADETSSRNDEIFVK